MTDYHNDSSKIIVNFNDLVRFRTCRKQYHFSKLPHVSVVHPTTEDTRSMQNNLLAYMLQYPDDLERVKRTTIEHILLKANIDTEDVDKYLEVINELIAVLSHAKSPIFINSQHFVPHNELTYIDFNTEAVIAYEPGMIVRTNNGLHIYDIRPTIFMPTEYSQQYYILDDYVTARWLFAERTYDTNVAEYHLVFLNVRPFAEIKRTKSGLLPKNKSSYINMTKYRALVAVDKEPQKYTFFVAEHTQYMRNKMMQQFKVIRTTTHKNKFESSISSILCDMLHPQTNMYPSISKKNCLSCAYQSYCIVDLNCKSST